MIEVLSGVMMFTLVVLALVALLLGARRRLVQSGEVTITINDDPAKALKVATLRLLITVHCHFATLNTSAGSSMRMSRLTFTWQASRQPRFASPRLM